MTFNIKFSGLSGQSQEILSAVQVVKTIWEKRLDSRKNITVNIDLKFSDFTTEPEVLNNDEIGRRFLELQAIPPINLTRANKQELTAARLYLQSRLLGITSAKDEFHINNVLYDQLLQSIRSSSTSPNDNLALSSLEGLSREAAFSKPVIRLTRANAKALGLLLGDNINIDARILLNTKSPRLNWEYNSSSDIESPKDQSRKDFIGLLSHEVGHALGFASENRQGGSSIAPSSPLDLFRFLPNASGTSTPELVNTELRKYFSIDRGVTPENYFSINENQRSDDNHFSQYKDNTDAAEGKVKTVTGLMSPFVLPRQDDNKRTNFNFDELQPSVVNTPRGRVVPGSFDRIRIADLVAFDIIGWDIKQINTGLIRAKAIKNQSVRSVGETLLLDKGSTKLPTNLDDIITLAPTNGTAVYGKGGYDTIAIYGIP
jgi:hypothetical protein